MSSKWEMSRKWNRTHHESMKLELTVKCHSVGTGQETMAQIRRFLQELDGDVDINDSISITLTHSSVTPDIREPYPREIEILNFNLDTLGLPCESYTEEEREEFMAQLERDQDNEIDSEPVTEDD